ncbi:MAG: hypothetical protein VKJ04_08680 [Vampirovibrionales bacterium]|nr:hypothetical protein [Vampirovibrionales bacterium]
MGAVIRGAGGLADALPQFVVLGRRLARTGGAFHYPPFGGFERVNTPMGPVVARFDVSSGQVWLEYLSRLRFQAFGDGTISDGVKKVAGRVEIVPVTINDHVVAAELGQKAYDWLA